jgi:hypothetical protein
MGPWILLKFSDSIMVEIMVMGIGIGIALIDKVIGYPFDQLGRQVGQRGHRRVFPAIEEPKINVYRRLETFTRGLF